jgi:hypothetical protein
MKWVKQFENWKSGRDLQLLLESIINIDPKITDILKTYQNSDNPDWKKISATILPVIGKEVAKNQYDQISLGQKGDKLQVVAGKQSYEQSVAKVIRNLLIAIEGQPTVKDDQIQKFTDNLVGKLKSVSVEKSSQMKIVKGTDIPFYYDKKNTVVKAGSELFNSCMSGGLKNDFLKMYEDNSEKIALVVKLVDGKLDARALLWKLDFSEAGDEYFFDRAYCNDNSDIESLYDFACDQIGSEKIGRKPNNFGQPKGVMVVKLKNVIFKRYPYVDTLKYLHIKKNQSELENVGILSNVTDSVSGVGTPENRLTPVLKKSPDWNSDYSWLGNEETHVPFELSSTLGIRKSISSENAQFENSPRFIVVKGLKINYRSGQELDDFRNLAQVVKLMNRTGDVTNLFDVELPDDEPSQDLIKMGDFYFPKEFMSKDKDGDPILKVVSAGISDVSEIYKENPEIKIGKKNYAFRKIYDLLAEYNPSLCLNMDSVDSKRYLSELDCKILDIDYKEANRIEFTSLVRNNFSKQNEFLKRIIDDPQKIQLVKLRESITYDVKNYDFNKKDFLTWKKTEYTPPAPSINEL